MPSQDEQAPDQRLDQALGNLLRAGVVLAAAVTLLGGISYVAAFWDTRSDHHTLCWKMLGTEVGKFGNAALPQGPLGLASCTQP